MRYFTGTTVTLLRLAMTDRCNARLLSLGGKAAVTCVAIGLLVPTAIAGHERALETQNLWAAHGNLGVTPSPLDIAAWQHNDGTSRDTLTVAGWGDQPCGGKATDTPCPKPPPIKPGPPGKK